MLLVVHDERMAVVLGEHPEGRVPAERAKGHDTGGRHEGPYPDGHLVARGEARHLDAHVAAHIRMAGRRAMLYLQGYDRRKATKAAGLGVDAVCLDMEDGVAWSRRGEARSGAVDALEEVAFRPQVLVRINRAGSGLEEEDISAVSGSRRLPHGIVLPKVEHRDHLLWASDRLDRVDPEQNMKLNALVESPQAILNLQQIVKGITRLESLIFGSDDYLAALGAQRTATLEELQFARGMIVNIAAAYNLASMDFVPIDLDQSDDTLFSESQRSFQLGFHGRQIIHPKQVDAVQRAYTPNSSRIQHARSVITAYMAHQRTGSGAFIYNGCMIDRPSVLQCELLLSRFGESDPGSS